MQVLGTMAMRNTKTVAVIPAAGAGSRMGGNRAKQFMELNGKPILALTLETFENCRSVDAVIVVVPPGDVNYCRDRIVEKFRLTKVEKVVSGGKRRQDSVRMGIEAADKDTELILIHDGVRPLITEQAIEHIIESALRHRAVISGLPSRETVKEVDQRGQVIRTCDRTRLWLIQTPQVFRYEDIREAHQRALRENWGEATDDAALIEKIGVPVRVIEGPGNNIKVTTPDDLAVVRVLLGLLP